MTRDQIASVYSVNSVSMPDEAPDKGSSSPSKPSKSNSNKAGKNSKVVAEKKPASIDEAVKKVSVNELKSLLEKVNEESIEQYIPG